MALKLTKRFVAYLSLSAALIIIATTLLFFVTQIKAVHTMPMSLQIVPSGPAGFDLNTTVMTYGRMRPGGISTRYFDINNPGGESLKIVARVRGTIAPFIVISPAVVVVPQGQEQYTMPVEANVPDDATPGNYTGTFTVYVMKP